MHPSLPLYPDPYPSNPNPVPDPYPSNLPSCLPPYAAQSRDPYWDEFFVFEVKHPAFSVLKVRVYDHLNCWRPALMGQLILPVKDIQDFPQR